MRLLPDGSPSAGDFPPLSAIQAKLARLSLAEFVKKSWPILEPTDPLIWNWHLDAICDHVQALLEGRIPKNNLVITVPPGSMKSRIVSVCAPCWWWIHQPSWRAIFSSTNPRLTMRDSVNRRTLLTSSWYQESFHPTWRFAEDQNTKSLYKNTAQGWHAAVSANAAITGERANALFWDDPLDAALANSRTEREGVIYWYDNAFANRLSSEKGVRCGIMQRLHEEDLAGHVIKSGEYEELKIQQLFTAPTEKKPRVVTSIGWTDPRTQDRELMFPARFSVKGLTTEKRRLGTAGFSAQQQQEPSPAGGLLFKRDWWRVFKMPDGHEGMTNEQLRTALGIQRIGSGFDTALTEKTANDFSSNHVIAQTQNRFLVLDHRKEKLEFPAVQKWVVANGARWKPEGIPIEGGGSASGKAIVQGIRMDTTLPAIEVPNIAKEVRAARVSPTVEAGVVYLPEGAPWVDEFIESMAKFPRGAHDDDVDSFCITLEWLLYGTTDTGMLDFLEGEMAELQRKREAAKKGAA